MAVAICQSMSKNNSFKRFTIFIHIDEHPNILLEGERHNGIHKSIIFFRTIYNVSNLLKKNKLKETKT